MNLKEIVSKLDLKVVNDVNLDVEVTGGYISDLLSDVIANSEEGNLWITLQTHQNIIAVALLKKLSGILIVNGREPEKDTVIKANEKGIPLLLTNKTSFEIAGKLYVFGVKENER